jgi:hypothetical protein
MSVGKLSSGFHYDANASAMWLVTNTRETVPNHGIRKQVSAFNILIHPLAAVRVSRYSQVSTILVPHLRSLDYILRRKVEFISADSFSPTKL